MEPLRSFKLQWLERHVRIVPRTDGSGCPFGGPGVDVRGDAAAELFVLAKPLVRALQAVEPGVSVRSLSADFDRRRLLVTLAEAANVEGMQAEAPSAARRPAAGKPRVVRMDGPTFDHVLRDAAPLVSLLTLRAHEAVARRSGA
jgi:hypothetical protein